MTVDEAAALLAEMYRQGKAKKEASTYVHLFAIEYADQLDGISLAELTERAGISPNYRTELHKGIKLAQYVQLKPS
jgi:hypothetical protein